MQVIVGRETGCREMQRKKKVYKGRHMVVGYEQLFGYRVPILEVVSSHIEEIGYSPSRSKMYVRFWNGSLYAYYRVFPGEWRRFVDAKELGYTYRTSKGKHFWRLFRGIKKYKRVY